MRAPTRTVNAARPTEVGERDGLAYCLWLPPDKAVPSAAEATPSGARTSPHRGVVIIHGADSCKESHHGFCRALLAGGCASLAFDQRGHGASPGKLDGRAITDVVTMSRLLRDRLGAGATIGLRGSSMGGCLSILAAKPAGAAAVVAICPASTEGMARNLRAGEFHFPAEAEALATLLDPLDLAAKVHSLTVPLLLMHAEGDDVVPVEHSRELARFLGHKESRLVTVPGGHHRSVQHDEELQATSLRFLHRHLSMRA